MATTIVLVRHGETDWNRERRFQGHADTPLNEEGRRQARALAEELAKDSFAAAYSSPLRRAFETAEIIGSRLGIPVEPAEGLKEVDLGSWSGLTTAEVEERFPEGFSRWREGRAGWTDGETYEALGRRVVSTLLELAERHPGERLLAVAHGGPVRSVLAAARVLPFDTPRAEIGRVHNCAAFRVAVRDGVIEEVD